MATDRNFVTEILGPIVPLPNGGPFPMAANVLVWEGDPVELVVTLKLRLVDRRPTLVGLEIGPSIGEPDLVDLQRWHTESASTRPPSFVPEIKPTTPEIVPRPESARIPEITARYVHNLPLDELTDGAVRAVAQTVATQAARRQAAADVEAQVMAAGRGAVSARRRRPVTDEYLREVARVIRENRGETKKQLAGRLHMSLRTFYRRRDEAIRRGYLTEEDGEETEE